MNSLFLVSSLLLAGAFAQQTFFDNDDIDDLQEFVDYPTKMKLKTLENNHYIPRSQKQQEFQQILSSQTQQVQDAFKQKQNYENMKRQQKLASLQQRMQWMPPTVANAYKQLMEAKSNMNLSDMEYWTQKNQIWGQLNGMDRHLDRQFGSHSSEEFY
ncbi:hypothetical protein QR680_014000 [Steinernema hermaphroditum]|uniref:SXP/RAL-2 family protein Ani s 5-like cation-binding domain-containing protein n=1 Tax=Steinernema hermaphroditum TaxID=289476 RepID=A0AA39I8Z4_9BILA|nr:hypothetical protein QR680_014000 [Steinernema hermaphroditum]